MNKKKILIIFLAIILLISIVAIIFIYYSRQKSLLNKTPTEDFSKAYFAGGCFWCVEADFEKLTGVGEAISGYMGGQQENPSYEDHADHREAVEVLYDPAVVSYEDLVQYFFRHHDPTDPDGSFYDRGFSYTSAIYPQTEEEEEVALKVIDELQQKEIFEKAIVTSVENNKKFRIAEEYHQDYYIKNPIRYNGYRKASGRDSFINSVWAERDDFEIVPSGANHRWKDFEKPPEEELRKKLTEVEYKVTQEDDTEKPFTEGNYDKNFETGIYVDIVSGEPLFSSKDKYDSETGWPSFTKPISYEFIVTKPDYKLVIPRTEVRSRYADSHIGHVFDDGPEPTGERWCMNGAAMRFVPLEEMEEQGYGDYIEFFEE